MRDKGSACPCSAPLANTTPMSTAMTHAALITSNDATVTSKAMDSMASAVHKSNINGSALMPAGFRARRRGLGYHSVQLFRFQKRAFVLFMVSTFVWAILGEAPRPLSLALGCHVKRRRNAVQLTVL